jgi:uncharacterized membrane-anchored protein
MSARVYNNTVGESIYKQIQDYDKVSRMVFLKNLPSESRKLYEKFLVAQRQRRYKESSDNKEKANEAAKLGMQKLRETKPKEVLKIQRKPWDIKYEVKRKLSREEAASVIQRGVRKNKVNKQDQQDKTTIKAITNIIGNKMVDDLVNNYLQQLPEKRKPGRPRKNT